MIEDMTVRNFVEKTRNDYTRHVRTFTAINGSVAALRFFFTVTLDRPEMARHLTFVREPRTIPVVLSPEEVARLPEAAPGPKYKAALSAAYAAGLRVSEVVALKVSDIDSERLLLRITQGKSLPPRRRGAQGSLCHALPPSCWSCRATDIASRGRRSGCSPAVIRCCR